MAKLRPFRAIRPTPDSANQVASVPYDVVGTAEAASLARDNPLSFLRVIRPEIALPDDTDPHSDLAYSTASQALETLLEDGALIRDSESAVYLYRQTMGEHQQIGVVGCCSVAEYDNNLIKKHERTRPDKEEDRTRHIMALGAQPGPVFLTYRDDPSINRLVRRIVSSETPLYDFLAEDGIGHTVWRVTESTELIDAFSRVPALYVADGHHRSASASRASQQRRRENPTTSNEEEHNFFLSVLFSAKELQILPYNRVIHDLNGSTPEEFLDRLNNVFEVTTNASPNPGAAGHFSMYLAGKWYGLETPGYLTDDPDPVECLDAAILQGFVLGPLLGIQDPRTATRIDFVGGIRGTDELAERVDTNGGVAFSLYPLAIEQLLAVSDADRVLPPKSTWFEPKLRSGLFVHEI